MRSRFISGCPYTVEDFDVHFRVRKNVASRPARLLDFFQIDNDPPLSVSDIQCVKRVL